MLNDLYILSQIQEMNIQVCGSPTFTTFATKELLIQYPF